jgi:acylphosphatase
MILIEARGNLVSLSEIGGFREFIKANALRLQIGGDIQRYNGYNVKLRIEGLVENIQAFLDFLNDPTLNMFSSISITEEKQIPYLHFKTFKILQNFASRTKNGEYSSHDYDRVSVSSGSAEVMRGSQKSLL